MVRTGSTSRMMPRPDVAAAAACLRERLDRTPDAALVLGSGLGHLSERMPSAVDLPFRELPGFPPAGVPGHAGRYVAGSLGGRYVLLQCGRYHVYEGHPLEVVAAPVRLAAALGVTTLISTNAVGGVNPRLGPGSVLLIDDHLNLMGRSPLAGPVAGPERRFPDMSAPYDRELQDVALESAAAEGIPLHRGTFAAVSGPSYETAAEVRMLRLLGADAVGMSTVPEVIVARASGIRCLAFSLVTNRATALGAEPLNHDEVVEVGRRSADRVSRLLVRVLERLSNRTQSTEAK